MMHSFKILAAVLVVGLINGCASIVTLTQTDARLEKGLKKWHKKCSYLPRIYSGVAYDFCLINGDPNNNSTNQSPTAIPLQIFDMAASAVIDTVALPYTAYEQCKYGSNNID